MYVMFQNVLGKYIRHYLSIKYMLRNCYVDLRNTKQAPLKHNNIIHLLTNSIFIIKIVMLWLWLWLMVCYNFYILLMSDFDYKNDECCPQLILHC